MSLILDEKWPVLRRHERALEWLHIWVDLGRAPRTMDAYARGLAEYLLVCEREGIDPVAATRAQIALLRNCGLARACVDRKSLCWIRVGVWRTRRCSSDWFRCGCSTTSWARRVRARSIRSAAAVTRRAGYVASLTLRSRSLHLSDMIACGLVRRTRGGRRRTGPLPRSVPVGDRSRGPARTSRQSPLPANIRTRYAQRSSNRQQLPVRQTRLVCAVGFHTRARRRRSRRSNGSAAARCSWRREFGPDLFQCR